MSGWVLAKIVAKIISLFVSHGHPSGSRLPRGWYHTPKIDQLVIPDELPCFDLTQIRMRILQFYKGLFESISLLFA